MGQNGGCPKKETRRVEWSKKPSVRDRDRVRQRQRSWSTDRSIRQRVTAVTSPGIDPLGPPDLLPGPWPPSRSATGALLGASPTPPTPRCRISLQLPPLPDGNKTNKINPSDASRSYIPIIFQNLYLMPVKSRFERLYFHKYWVEEYIFPVCKFISHRCSLVRREYQSFNIVVVDAIIANSINLSFNLVVVDAMIANSKNQSIIKSLLILSYRILKIRVSTQSLLKLCYRILKIRVSTQSLLKL